MNPKNVYGVNIVLIKRGTKSFVPGGNDSLLPDDTIFVVGGTKEIRVFREALNGLKKKRKAA
jgi:Trk K+ transport system NAD-binding subunit